MTGRLRFPADRGRTETSTARDSSLYTWQIIPLTIRLYPCIFLCEERHCESKVSCPITKHNDPGQGSHWNPVHKLNHQVSTPNLVEPFISKHNGGALWNICTSKHETEQIHQNTWNLPSRRHISFQWLVDSPWDKKENEWMNERTNERQNNFKGRGHAHADIFYK